MAKIQNPEYEFNPFEDAEIPRNKLKAAREAVREFVLDRVLGYVGDAKSPVAGESWKKTLSPKYKDKKRKESGSTEANLELTGEMLDELDIIIKGNNLILKVNDPSQAGKSDGHNNHSGKSRIEQRRFIPEEGQKFKKDIEQGIKEIVEEFSIKEADDE